MHTKSSFLFQIKKKLLIFYLIFPPWEMCKRIESEKKTQIFTLARKNWHIRLHRIVLVFQLFSARCIFFFFFSLSSSDKCIDDSCSIHICSVTAIVPFSWSFKNLVRHLFKSICNCDQQCGRKTIYFLFQYA